MPQPRKRRRPPPARAAAYDVADASGGLTAAELSSLCITGRAATLHRAPVAPATLLAEGASPAFVEYLRAFRGFVG